MCGNLGAPQFIDSQGASQFTNSPSPTLDLRSEGLVSLEEEQHRGHQEVVHDGEGEGLEA